jgi:nicotinamidase-related amidase
MKTALVLIDIQNDYFPGGRMELEGSPEAGDQARRLLTCFRQNGFPLVHIQHISTRPGATFFLPGTQGIEFHAVVRPLEGETVFQKHYPNSFRDTPLLNHLRDQGIERLVIAGMMTHMCVDATTRAAFDHGFACLVAGDACATRALAYGGKNVPAAHVHAAFLAALNGTYAKVSSADQILSELDCTPR